MTTININLLPEELRPVAGSGGGSSLPPKDVLMPIGIGAVVAVLLAAAPTLYTSMVLEPRVAELTAKNDELDQEIQKYNTSLNSLKAIADKKEQLRQQLATLQGVAQGGGPGLADMLNELRALTPANLWFESLTSDSGKATLQLTGAALDYSSVAFFQRNLQHSEYFENPVLGQTQMSASAQGGVNVVKFTMDIALKKGKKG
jgi:Tfp pilus assembly protein PilN